MSFALINVLWNVWHCDAIVIDIQRRVCRSLVIVWHLINELIWHFTNILFNNNQVMSVVQHLCQADATVATIIYAKACEVLMMSLQFQCFPQWLIELNTQPFTWMLHNCNPAKQKKMFYNLNYFILRVTFILISGDAVCHVR